MIPIAIISLPDSIQHQLTIYQSESSIHPTIRPPIQMYINGNLLLDIIHLNSIERIIQMEAGGFWYSGDLNVMGWECDVELVVKEAAWRLYLFLSFLYKNKKEWKIRNENIFHSALCWVLRINQYYLMETWEWIIKFDKNENEE